MRIGGVWTPSRRLSHSSQPYSTPLPPGLIALMTGLHSSCGYYMVSSLFLCLSTLILLGTFQECCLLPRYKGSPKLWEIQKEEIVIFRSFINPKPLACIACIAFNKYLMNWNGMFSLLLADFSCMASHTLDKHCTTRLYSQPAKCLNFYTKQR